MLVSESDKGVIIREILFDEVTFGQRCGGEGGKKEASGQRGQHTQKL